MNILLDFLVSTFRDVIIGIVVNPFRYILKRHGLISALCFAVCMILIGYKIVLYSNNQTIGNGELEMIQQAASNGNVDAQKKLGDLYFNGIGVEQDYKKAFIYYIQSAERGNTDAQYQIGLMYCEGKGVSVDYHKAYLYYAISDINGNPHAYLDGMYEIRKLLSMTEIADITIEAQSMAKKMRRNK